MFIRGPFCRSHNFQKKKKPTEDEIEEEPASPTKTKKKKKVKSKTIEEEAASPEPEQKPKKKVRDLSRDIQHPKYYLFANTHQRKHQKLIIPSQN